MVAEKKCFEFFVKNKVQNVGLRLAIAKNIPDELDVRTDNMPDGTVRVLLRGEKEDVLRFWKSLQEELLGEVKNPTFSHVAQVSLASVDTDRFYHKLQCDQMEKFVHVGLEMKDAIQGMSSTLTDMNSTLAGMNSKLDSLPANLAKEIVRLKREGCF